MTLKNLGSSVRARIHNKAKADQVNMQFLFTRLPKSACRWMQALYLESVNGNVRVKDLIEQLANLDREQQDRLVFEDTESGWREAA